MASATITFGALRFISPALYVRSERAGPCFSFQYDAKASEGISFEGLSFLNSPAVLLSFAPVCFILTCRYCAQQGGHDSFLANVQMTPCFPLLQYFGISVVA